LSKIVVSSFDVRVSPERNEDTTSCG
jgi:hypothetical protein